MSEDVKKDGILNDEELDSVAGGCLVSIGSAIPLMDNLLSDEELGSVAGGARKGATFNYTIQKGDTLTKIAKRYGCTVAELVELNNIANKDLIYAGHTLKIPKR